MTEFLWIVWAFVFIHIMQIQLTSQKSSAYMSFCFILTVVYFASIAYHISVAEKTIEFEGKLSVKGPSIKDIRFFGPFFDLPTHPYPIISDF